ncbi:MAG: double-strand break repair helicase AddA [Rhodobacter sp.]|nr:double-strand break repair helicase AddA [Rhodobacter sp.]
MSLDAATHRQNRAAEPTSSTWLSANAGSGKTRVLTDRVARLLLDKVPPQNILCLTYTKAAASEMQNRLFRRLGDWSLKPDEALRAELAELGVTASDAEFLAEARRLFARAIETPGGLRIQTIHSFCASLLRRFPLEAGVSPDFVEIDEMVAARLRDSVVEELATGPARDALDGLVANLTDDDLGDLTAAIARNRTVFAEEASDAEIRSWFGTDGAPNLAALLRETFRDNVTALIPRLLSVLETGSVNDVRAWEKLRDLNWTAPGRPELEALFSVLLTGRSAANPFAAKTGKFPTKASRDLLGPLAESLDMLMQRVEVARERLNALLAAERTAALYKFARAFLPAYDAHKKARGWLDFDDLILGAHALLSDPTVATWVLFKLDGGLDHILVDEAQDTSPAQWQVIEGLAQEFTAGLGARDDVLRTIFVVGDKKQSIYSFQGAVPGEFERMRDFFRGRLQSIEVGLRDLQLEYSFRSSSAILQFVEAALPEFSDADHRAFHDKMPGRVDWWPALPVAERPEKGHWYDPVDMRADDHHDTVLASRLADEIGRLIAEETIPRPDGTRRRVTAGDILILVRRRSALFEEIIRACKARGLAVAGADRLRLGAELAVRDLAALLAFLATPEDDLSLAATLKSPLFGWSEAQLYDLAANRSQVYLWAALRQRAKEVPETFECLRDLRDAADFLRPYDLIERILIRHDGRRKLLARLGPEAEDGIDVLLSQSLAYERMEIPSLTGFLGWLETGDVEVKRQMDNAGDQIRVMTVHGAKGLESPIVILPDTAKRALPVRDEVIPLGPKRLAWKMPTDQQPAQMADAVARIRQAQEDEAMRLFYVAATRAETWLIVAAAGDTGGPGNSWHQIAGTGLQSLGAEPLATPTGAGLRYGFGDWQAGDLAKIDVGDTAEPDLPDWPGTAAAIPERAPLPLSPSDLGGAKALGGAGALEEEDAKAHGTRVHRLMEFLPRYAPKQWSLAARNLLGTAGGTEVADALEEARRVLIDPDLAFLFAPDVLAEVDLSAMLPDLGDRRISGTIDRLLLRPDRVLAVDFKTNAVVPDAAADTPEGVLRQMGAYSAALQQLYPGRTVETAILWTKGPRLMALPHDIVRQALRRAATS